MVGGSRLGVAPPKGIRAAVARGAEAMRLKKAKVAKKKAVKRRVVIPYAAAADADADSELAAATDDEEPAAASPPRKARARVPKGRKPAVASSPPVASDESQGTADSPTADSPGGTPSSVPALPDDACPDTLAGISRYMVENQIAVLTYLKGAGISPSSEEGRSILDRQASIFTEALRTCLSNRSSPATPLSVRATGTRATEEGAVGHDSGKKAKVRVEGPVLNLDSLSPAAAVTAVEGFLRRVETYFESCEDSGESTKRLYLEGALKGERLNRWLNEYASARGPKRFTSGELLAAIRAQLTDPDKTRAHAAWDKLAALKHSLREGETIASYRNRLDALCSVLPTMNEDERIYHFLRGLATNPTLAGACARNREGLFHTSLEALVAQADAELDRIKAAQPKRPRSALRSASAIAALFQEGEEEEDPEAPRTPKKAKRAKASAASAGKGKGKGKGASGAGKGGQGKGKGTQRCDCDLSTREARLKHAQTCLWPAGGKTTKLFLEKHGCTRQQLWERYADRVCLRCGNGGHRSKQCRAPVATGDDE